MITLPDGTQYRVILQDHTGDPGADAHGRIEITNNVQVLEVHDASPISARITLNIRGGRYRTYAPIIQKWDRIYIEIIDIKGNQFKTVVHVQDRDPIRQAGKGLQLVLTCPHQSSNLMTRTISKPNIARLQPKSSGFDAMNDALQQIDDNSGAKDPIITFGITIFDPATKIGSDLDPTLANDYIFESQRFQDVVDQILAKEGDVVENGGAFQFHYFRFQSKYDYSAHTGLDDVVFQIFPQGYHKVGSDFISTPTITIQKNPLGSAPSTYRSTSGKLESERATNLIAIGNKTAGSYPKDFSVFQGEHDKFFASQEWNSTDTYSQNHQAKVTIGIGTLFYKALSFVPANLFPPTNPLYWLAVNFTPSVDYSPLTKQSAQYWINNGAGWANIDTENAEVGVVDPNVIIHDALHPRTWVDTVAVDTDDLDGLGVLDNSVISHRPFDGLRVLVAGTGLHGFSGLDPNGLSFSDMIAEYREQFPGDPDGAWYVKIIPTPDYEIFSYRECQSWTYKPCTGLASYVDGSGACQLGSRDTGWVAGAYLALDLPGIGTFGHFTSLANFDCVHPIKHNAGANAEIGNIGIDTDLDPSGNSAVYANFDTDPFGNNTQNPPFTRSYFAGLNFAWPYPRNANNIPYGSGTIVGEKIALRVFDLLNMFQDHTGGREWFGSNVEDFYPIQSFAFFELLKDLTGLGLLNPNGNYKMGLWLADRNDAEVLIEYTHGHNNVAESQDAPVGKVKVYHAIPGIATWLPAPIPEILDIFDWRTAIRGGVYTMDSFDDRGRYYLTLPPPKFAFTKKLTIALDAFRMTKPLVATNNTDIGALPDRNIEPQKIQAPQIISYAQLSNMVKSLAQIYNFEPHNYTVETAGRCDLPFGDPAYYTDDELIDVTTDSLPNTEKCVVDGIIYSISKGLDGPGGFIRTLNLITRLWPS